MSASDPLEKYILSNEQDLLIFGFNISLIEVFPFFLIINAFPLGTSFISWYTIHQILFELLVSQMQQLQSLHLHRNKQV